MALKPVSVTQLNGYIKRILQTDPILGNVSVIGEISNLKYHGSGHVYFTLKDENSRINCFLPSDQRQYLRFSLADGMEVTASGFIYLYERGGSYSLNVRQIDVQGAGSLSLAFERLKKQLEKEGLFDGKYKKPIPFFPEKVAVITSPTGAAVRDILKIIQGRNRYVDVMIFPCLVQGPEAGADIARCIDTVNRLYPAVDVIIAGRGGGSMEELWAFNEEAVARSIFHSKIPVISAVGHETDFTIADFVADVRAETPTAAAALAAPDLGALKEYGDKLLWELSRSISQRLEYYTVKLSAGHPGEMLSLLQRKLRMAWVETRAAREGMDFQIKRRLAEAEHQMIRGQLRLEGLNPYAPLDRGYGMVCRGEGGFLSSVVDVKEGDPIQVTLKDGVLDCLVDKILPKELGKKEGGC